MKKFKNLKISIKLIICFFITGLLAVAVGVVGIASMNISNKNAIKIYEDGLIPTRDLSIVQKNLVLIQTDYVYMLFERDATKFDQRIEQIAQLTQQDNEVLHEYANSDISDKEKTLLNELKENLNSYRSIRVEFEEYLKNENYIDAEKIATEVDAERIKVDDSINSLIEENNLHSELLLQNIEKRFRSSFIFMVAIITIGLFLSIIMGLIVARLVSKPLHEIVDSANSIANGDLNITLNIDTEDEMGDLGEAFMIMSNKLNDVMSNINIASEQVASGSRQVSDSSISLSQGATEQASSIEQLTASIEEIASQTKQNAVNANEANKLAETGKNYAIEGNKQIQELLSSMIGINESSNNIFKIIKVIDEIAFQTNILALNASVEAARAGQHGRGFAVVAEEVKNLAQRSANASKETATMIEDSMKKVEEGTKLANISAEALDKIEKGFTKASILVGDIAIATNEQAIGVEQINQGVNQIATVVQTTSATSEETASASEELYSQAQMLKNQISTFKLKKNNHSPSYKDIEELNPDVLKMLESMSEKNNNTSEDFKSEMELTSSPKTIELSDMEFGKY